MFPILVPLGHGIAIRSYGVMVAVALLVGIAITRRRAVARGIPVAVADEIAVAAVVWGLVGARLYYVLFTDPALFTHRPLEVLAVWRGGLAVHGGWIGGTLAALVAIRKRRVSFWCFADAIAPVLALGQAIGRIGCFLSGCCFGLPTDLPWGVTFHHPQTLAPRGLPLHPTQLYESALDLAVFGILRWFERGSNRSPRGRLAVFERRRRCDGEVFLLYLMLSSVVRFVVEAWRWDSLYLWGTTLKMAQLVSAVLFIVSAALWVSRRQAGDVQPCEGRKSQVTSHK